MKQPLCLLIFFGLIVVSTSLSNYSYIDFSHGFLTSANSHYPGQTFEGASNSTTISHVVPSAWISRRNSTSEGVIYGSYSEAASEGISMVVKGLQFGVRTGMFYKSFAGGWLKKSADGLALCPTALPDGPQWTVITFSSTLMMMNWNFQSTLLSLWVQTFCST